MLSVTGQKEKIDARFFLKEGFWEKNDSSPEVARNISFGSYLVEMVVITADIGSNSLMDKSKITEIGSSSR